MAHIIQILGRDFHNRNIIYVYLIFLNEMEQQVQRTGCKNSLTAGIALCILLTIVKLRAGESYYDVYAVWGLMACVYNLYVWKELKDKSNLFLGVAWGISSLFCLVQYVMGLF